MPAPGVAPVADPLVQYALDLINKDRTEHGLNPVVLGDNPAAQIHADDMFNNYYLSHWDTDGLKPYMRYTVGNGINREEENSAYSGWYDRSTDPNRYATIDPEQELKDLEYQMMYDDAVSDWGHRDNILNKWHKRVNIGIAHDSHRLTLVQQFEGDYVTFSRPPGLANGVLSLAGNNSLGAIDSAAVFYDPPPRPMTQAELLAGPRSYDPGTQVATIVPPPEPGYFYSQLPANAVQAAVWEVSSGGFSIQVDISNAMAQNGPGVYTVLLWTKTGDEHVPITNYSIFVH
jgi:hypothetical protein